MPRVESLDEITWQELRAVLDEEIGALPERQRATVVLCYLQGKSYEEAARELGWPKSSLASRISRAKETLRQRLTRRGIAISTAALSAALAEGTAGAEVPALLTINTVHGAALIAAGKTAAAVSTAALAMAEESIRSIAIAKAGIVLLVLAAGVAVGSLGIASSSPFAPRMGALPQTERRQTEKPSTPEKTPRAEEPANPLNETFTFGGRVLDPDGKPFAGAKVFVCGLNPGVIEFRERTVSGSDGTFRIVIRRDEFGEKGVVAPGRSPPERNVFIGATAEGFGAACDSAYKPEDREKLTLWLPAEEIVRGRLMDLEGKPVQGPEISAYIRGRRPDQTTHPIPLNTPSQAGYYSGNVLPFDESRNLTKSDKDGRFTLRGLGRGWLYDLHISGPTVVNAKAELVARPEPAKEVGGTGI